MTRLILAALATLAPLTVAAQDAAPTPEDIAAASYDGGDLPEGQSAITVVVQTLLDRAGISPGVIDGYAGGMSTSAISAFETREGLTVDGAMDAEVWSALGGEGASAILQNYTITEEDTNVFGSALPEDYAELAELDAMPYERVSEAVAERFHMDEDFLVELNPGAGFTAGETVTVIATGEPLSGTVARIEVRKPSQRLVAFDAEDNIIGNYPVTIGSDDTPSPEGEVEVLAVAFDPTYSYNPSENFQQGDNEEPLTLPPGPNGPVGTIWIDLSEPTYGIHGTPHPSKLFTNASHGCVRMTNWDAEELAEMVEEGTMVSFVE